MNFGTLINSFPGVHLLCETLSKFNGPERPTVTKQEQLKNLKLWKVYMGENVITKYSQFPIAQSE